MTKRRTPGFGGHAESVAWRMPVRQRRLFSAHKPWFDLAKSTKIAGSQSVTKALVVDGTLMWNGQQLQQGMIFDPTTGNPFPGNLIPQDRISNLSSTVIDFYRQYYRPENSGLINNYGIEASANAAP